MKTSPAFQFYPADWLADANVQMMTLEEEGAYIRLLAFCWREGSLPDDDEQLSRLAKGGSQMVLRVVRKCFNQSPTEPGRLVHARLEQERMKQAAWREKSAEGGRKSGETRRTKDLSSEGWFKGGSRVVEPKGNSSSSSSSSFSSLSSKEENNYVHGERAPVHAPPPMIERPPDPRESWFDEFWAVYGKIRNVDKKAAKASFLRAMKTEEDFRFRMGRLRIQEPGYMAREPRLRPHATTWLNGARWNDDPDPAPVALHAAAQPEQPKDKYGYDEEDYRRFAKHGMRMGRMLEGADGTPAA